jgi:hypothetical protein
VAIAVAIQIYFAILTHIFKQKTKGLESLYLKGKQGIFKYLSMARKEGLKSLGL